VKVTVVFPGAVSTNIAANSGVELTPALESGHKQKSNKALPPGKAVQIIMNGIEKDRYRVLVGSDSVFMDLIYRISSKRAANLIFKKIQRLLS